MSAAGEAHHPKGSQDDAPYDVIVIGAGSAGAVVAARASERPDLRVLLLEAGPDYPALAALPFDLVNSHNNSYRAHDWGLSHTPTAGRSVPFPRGRVVGGSSAVNTTIALRGVPEDYDGWAALGNPGWGWSEVLPAFRRLERDLDFPDAAWHGDAGPIPIRRYGPTELLPQHSAFLDAATGLGYPACADGNDPAGWGAGPQPMNKLGRLRVSTAIGYLAAARARQNLTIRADTLVRRLDIRQGRCMGVEVETPSGTPARIRGRLVVCSAGAINTPGVLMRSGIGPRRDVERLGVDLVADVPGVGANLCDHPALAVVCTVRDHALADFDAPLIQTILRYTAPGSGFRNDLQIEQLTFSGRPNPGQRRGSRFAIAAVLEYQEGRGRLRVTDADPRAAPEIENDFCVNDSDRRRLAGCLQDALAFTKTPPLRDLIDTVAFPDPARGHDLPTLEEMCRRYAGSGYHPCGTARMGPADDAGAVVDARGRCHQVPGLVVADASIMPFVPRANTNLTCIMIGERIGEWLRRDPAQFGL